jgi:pyruvate dehydrogenase E2 component (dihydrolipoamide acetyltransferase)
MRYEFRLPDIGEGLTEAVIANWSAKAGEAIREDEPLCEIETDKALVEITAPCTGTLLETTGAPGETLKVGTVIAVFETDRLPAGASASDQAPAAKSEEVPAPAPDVAPASAAPVAFDRAVRATPATRRHAREKGVDLNAVTGTGPAGRVLQADVERSTGGGQAGAAGQGTSSVAARFALSPIPHEEGQTRLPLTGLRRTIADQMVRSVSIIPHASSAFRCDAERFAALRKVLQERLGVRISFTAMVMRAMVPALQKFPFFNYSIDDTTQEIVCPPSISIGFAAHTDDGLIVPVVKHCERKSLAEIAQEVDRLAEQARTRKIALADLRGGTITLSNVGSHGRVETTGGRLIVNHPQAAIIGISRIRPQAVVRDGQIVAAQCLDINTSYDHRLIDGIYANLFMEQLVDVIEEPGMMLAA